MTERPRLNDATLHLNGIEQRYSFITKKQTGKIGSRLQTSKVLIILLNI